MKSVPASLQSHFEQAPTTLASCWKIVRSDGEEYYFTDHDKDITFLGNLYLSKSGYSRTSIESNSSFAVDNLDIDAIFDNDVISEQELRAGLFDFAVVTVYLVNYKSPEIGGVVLRRGWLGEVLLKDSGVYKTELRGLTQVFSQNVVEVYSPTCRADLGDSRCKVPITDPFWTKTGVVTAVSANLPRTVFDSTITGDPAINGWFNGGLVIWQTGDNAGRKIEVKYGNATGGVELFLPTGYDVQVGDTFTIRPGCNKLRTTCINKYNNILNFRGEPFVPGVDRAMKVGK